MQATRSNKSMMLCGKRSFAVVLSLLSASLKAEDGFFSIDKTCRAEQASAQVIIEINNYEEYCIRGVTNVGATVVTNLAPLISCLARCETNNAVVIIVPETECIAPMGRWRGRDILNQMKNCITTNRLQRVSFHTSTHGFYTQVFPDTWIYPEDNKKGQRREGAPIKEEASRGHSSE